MLKAVPLQMLLVERPVGVKSQERRKNVILRRADIPYFQILKDQKGLYTKSSSKTRNRS